MSIKRVTGRDRTCLYSWNVQDLVKRFSLGYLLSGAATGSAQRSGQAENRPLQEAIDAYLSVVLGILDSAPNKSQEVFTIFDRVRDKLPGSTIDKFRQVLKWMTDQGLVRTLKTDPYGNDLIQKT
jgi:hypothetical protein